jgi:hypothetical protein
LASLQNDWAPVHQSIAGPLLFAFREGFLVGTSFNVETWKARGLCALVSRYVLNCRRRK